METTQSATTDRDAASAASNRAFMASGIVEFIAWLNVIGSVIGGIFLITKKEEGNYSWESTTPYAVEGWIFLVSGVFVSLIVIMFAAYIRSRTGANRGR